MFKKHAPKLFLFNLQYLDEDFEDAGISSNETDRIPSVLFVRRFDLFCFVIAILSYLCDFLSDVVVGTSHMIQGRYLTGVLILLFAFVPSLILNIVSFIWVLDDTTFWNKKFQRRRKGLQDTTNDADYKPFMSLQMVALVCIAQMGPLLWYFKAIHHGLNYRSTNSVLKKREAFCKMVEAERDATLLRFFEAYLESAPQLIIQGTVIADFFLSYRYHGTQLPIWVYLQCISMIISCVSISWSIVVQNRSLRMVQEHKVNLWPHEAVLQFIWRFLTVSSRLLVVAVAVLYFKQWTFLFLGGHLFASLFHIMVLQSISIEGINSFESALLCINAFIHTFTPFNMAEGQTRYRYAIAYALEFVEMTALFAYISADIVHEPLLQIGELIAFGGFLLGIITMIVYHGCFHPSKREEPQPQPTVEMVEIRSLTAM